MSLVRIQEDQHIPHSSNGRTAVSGSANRGSSPWWGAFLTGPPKVVAERMDMPKYDFRCPTCETVVELYKEFKDNSVPTCEVCNVGLSKVFQATPAVFRGGGWGGQ